MRATRRWVVAAFLGLLAPLPAFPAPQFLGSWNMPPGGASLPGVPYCVAVGPDDHVYVTDQSMDRVCKFTRTGTLVRMWGASGSQPGNFEFPLGISVSPDGRVYVVDHALARVQVFDGDGTLLFAFGTRGTGLGQLLYPRDVAVDFAGNVYVADHDNGRVQKFTSDGAFLASIGQGVLVGPVDLVVDPNGRLHVTDELRWNRILLFDPVGQLLGTWGEPGSAPGRFSGPGGICRTSDGHFFVVDHRNSRVQELSGQGVFLSSWNTAEAGLPIGDVLDIAAHQDGGLVVTDAVGRRVLRFAHTPTSVTLSTWGAVKARFRGGR